MKKVFVISLGGSQIFIDNKINVSYLKKFKSIIKRYFFKYKFVIVTGGGSVARTYINGLKSIDANVKLQNFAGISVTRTNARFISYFFGEDCLEGVPHTMSNLKKMLNKKNIVFTGALEYHPNQTSDSTAAQIAREFNGEFINITNVDGLFSSNPLKNKNAKLIKEVSWRELYKIASKIAFHPGQHFVLDQVASKIILDEKIKTYIIGNDLRNLVKVIEGKKFRGTLIEG